MLRGRAIWLGVSVPALGLLTFLVANAPERVKLIGLFPLGVGCLAGIALGLLARELRVPPSRYWIVPVWCLIAGVQIGMTWLAYSRRAEFLQSRQEKDPLSEVTQQVLTNDTGEETVESRATLEALRESVHRGEEIRRERVTFAGYLQYRVTALGKWEAPWPTVFWATEVLIAATAGTWLAWRMHSLARPE